MLTKEAIVLAGGLGTRLQTVVSDVPKALAMVAGQPFLYHVLQSLKQQGISRLIFSLGYKHQLIEEYLWEWKDDFEMAFAIENEPMGTGGGIKNALKQVEGEQCFILNADTLFNADLSAMDAFHQQQMADLTIALKPLKNFDRYGIVLIDDLNNITAFKEKQPTHAGLINGGIYLMNKQLFDSYQFPDKFSFEKDFLETHLNLLHFKGFISDTYFIDIGIPHDFEKANRDLAK